MSILDKFINDENTFVSVDTLKKVVSASEREMTFSSTAEQEELLDLNEYLLREINEMKEVAASSCQLCVKIPGTKDTSPPAVHFIGSEEERNAPMGIPTDYFIDGIRLYSGDEVVTDKGWQGVIILAEEGARYKDKLFNVHIRFHRGNLGYNNEFLVLNKEEYPLFGLPKISLETLEFVRHFNTCKKNDKIVNISHTGEHFVVSKETADANKQEELQ